MSTLTLVTPPAVEPVTFLEVRDFLRVGDSDEELVNLLIPMAREYVERSTGRALITQTWRLSFHDKMPTAPIKLPKAPIQSVSSFAYYDSDNAAQTLATSDYELLLSQDFASSIRMQDGASWPTVYNKYNAASITFVAGYGATGASVPRQIIKSIWLLLVDLMENRNMRGVNNEGAAFELPRSIPIVDRCLLNYRLLDSCKSTD